MKEIINISLWIIALVLIIVGLSFANKNKLYMQLSKPVIDIDYNSENRFIDETDVLKEIIHNPQDTSKYLYAFDVTTIEERLKNNFAIRDAQVYKTVDGKIVAWVKQNRPIARVINHKNESFYMDEDGQEHIVMFSIEDWWTSDIGSFITQTPADFNVQCLEKTELIMFSFDIIEELYTEIPKLERCFRQIIEKAFVSSQKRLIRNFSLSAKDRYLYFKNQYPKIEQRIPQYMVASYLGITKEFLSKIKSQLIQEQ